MVCFNQPDCVITAIRHGRPVILLHRDAPESEGELFVAAAEATATTVAFLIRHSSGYLRAAVPRSISRRLRIPAMHPYPQEENVAHCVSVDAASGITTGISAADRARTLRILADPAATPNDLCRPGHIVVAESRDSSMSHEQDATNLAVALAHTAELPPVGALCGLVSQDNPTRMATRAEILAFANEHALAAISATYLHAYLSRTSEAGRTPEMRSVS